MAKECHRGTPVTPIMRLGMTVEGRTEELFVASVLSEHLRQFNIETSPVIIGKARNRQTQGGNVTIERLAEDMAGLYWNYGAVTSLVDYYGFKNRESMPVEKLEKRLISEIKKKIGKKWNADRVIPYIQMYEFEGLLFSEIEMMINSINAPKNEVEELKASVNCDNPEEINNNFPPSKRIKSHVSMYNKTRDGHVVAGAIGIGKICEKCPRFKKWIKDLESLQSAG